MKKKYNEHYTDDSRMSRVVTPKSKEQWFEWMNERIEDFPQPSFNDIINELERSLSSDLESLEYREYFKEEIPVKLKDIPDWSEPWTDHHEIRLLKNKIGQKRYQLELLKSIKE